MSNESNKMTKEQLIQIAEVAFPERVKQFIQYHVICSYFYRSNKKSLKFITSYLVDNNIFTIFVLS